MHATDPVESKPRKLGYDSVHMEGRDKRTLAEAPGQSPSKTRTHCCELAEEQWLEVSMAGTSSSAYRPIEAPAPTSPSPLHEHSLVQVRRPSDGRLPDCRSPGCQRTFLCQREG